MAINNNGVYKLEEINHLIRNNCWGLFTPPITGNIWQWGATSPALSIPTIIDTDTDWVSVTGLSSTGGLAIKTDGTMWSFGSNNFGQLGLGDTVNRSSFTQIGTDTDWKCANGYTDHGAAIKTDGTLWTWGSNLSGQLGHGDTTDRLVPTQVGTDTDWDLVVCSNSVTMATKTNGEIWGSGGNASNQLGNGNNVNTNSMSQTLVPPGKTWVLIKHNLTTGYALTDTNELWAWGGGGVGQIGEGANGYHSTPVQVPNLFTHIAANRFHAIGVRDDGTLWHWGRAPTSNTGFTSLFSQTQIGSDTDWNKVSSGSYFNHIIKTDGTLWGIFRNQSSQLGIGATATYEPSPVQVSTDTNWLSMDSVFEATVALKQV